MVWSILFSLLQGAATAVPALTPEHFTVDSKSGIREFYLYTPSARPRGLVVMLHGCKTTASEFDQGTEMSQYGALHNLAVLYPEQSVFANYDRCWNWFWGTENDIIAEGIRQVQARFGLGRHQTVLMGMSAGAAEGAILANCYRNLFSGVLLHSGLQYLAATNLSDAQASLEYGAFTSFTEAARIGFQCNRSLEPLKFMIVYGDQDKRVNPKNSLQSANQLAELNRLINLAANRGAYFQVSKNHREPSAPMLSYRESLITLNQTVIGSVIQVNGLAHEWSGGNPIQPRNNPYGPKVIEKFLMGIR